MKVAIVHPWFWDLGGGEKVIEALISIYPHADIFVLVYRPRGIPESLRERPIHTSFLNRIPGIARFRQRLLFLYPAAIESLDLSHYDLVLSSAGPVTCGVNVPQHALHICYCHSPTRSLWDQYAQRQKTLSPVGRLVFTTFATYVRTWEYAAAQRVDHFVSNSHYIAGRVRRYFRRESEVIYPPVNTSIGYVSSKPGEYYLSVGRLGERKCLEILVQACNRLQRRLLVAGTGPEEKRLKALAGPTIEFLGYVPDAALPELYANCRAFLFAADEDFGIAPVEAQAFGRPVIAYGHGGVLETVCVSGVEEPYATGVFFPEQTTESAIDGMMRFEKCELDFVPREIQRHASQFDTSVFAFNMKRFIAMAMGKEREDGASHDIVSTSYDVRY
jgi:glycosyltransferase involved in cell wall biosynthesis